MVMAMTATELTRQEFTIAEDALTVVLTQKGTDGVVLLINDVEGLAELGQAVGASGAKDELIPAALPVNGSLRPIVFVGLGTDAESIDAYRLAGGALGRKHLEVEVLALAGSHSPEAIEAFATGYLLGDYRFESYLSEQGAQTPSLRVASIEDKGAEIDEALNRAKVIADAVNRVRDLVMTPPNHLYPESFAERARESAERAGAEFRVWDEQQLEAEGFGGHIGVGKGSIRPPRLARLAYRPAGATKHIALVGKGITFDTGGLSLKPAGAMVGMKFDMAGAATILGVIEALAALEVKINVTGWLCMAENMPSDRATRPDDIITMKGGTSVEVTNTDAEGRLVLADGLVMASQDELRPDAIIDIATLTGAQLIALGERTTGVMGNNEDLIDRVIEASREVGEPAWPMPIPEEIHEPLKSDVADLANARPGNRNGGMVMAAAFLSRFIGEDAEGELLPWAHLDIAGPSNNEGSAYGYTPKGATGCMVRTLVALAESEATK